MIGVFGELEVTPGRHIPFSAFSFETAAGEFISQSHVNDSTRGPREEAMVSVWPKACMPIAGPATLAEGKKVYNANCASCHKVLGPEGRKDPNREIIAELRTLDVVGTDPTMAMNFVARRGKTGPFKGAPNVVKFNVFGSEASGRDLLLAAVDGVFLHDGVPVSVYGLDINVPEELISLQKALEAERTARYKARPLNGIWATAPYLHNGSVPTLYDLLNPPNQRPSTFTSGDSNSILRKLGLAPLKFRAHSVSTHRSKVTGITVTSMARLCRGKKKMRCSSS